MDDIGTIAQIMRALGSGPDDIEGAVVHWLGKRLYAACEVLEDTGIDSRRDHARRGTCTHRPGRNNSPRYGYLHWAAPVAGAAFSCAAGRTRHFHAEYPWPNLIDLFAPAASSAFRTALRSRALSAISELSPMAISRPTFDGALRGSPSSHLRYETGVVISLS